ncbi:MAG: cytochrome c-type biogenesis protein CcmH [bacterium]|nr:cytochrome c-type biogenesis protein CcmH [bacterium]
MTRSRAKSWLRGVLVAALALALSGCADEGPYTQDLSSELMSPFCPGRTLASCPSPQAGELIQWIQVQEAAGATKDEVVAMLIDRFGEEIQGAPPAEGITLWAYVFPVAGFLGGGGLVAVVLRRIVGRRDDDDEDDDDPDDDSAPPAPPSGPTSPEDDELARLVDEELSNRR